jgi:FkbM family methyltransferase
MAGNYFETAPPPQARARGRETAAKIRAIAGRFVRERWRLLTRPQMVDLGGIKTPVPAFCTPEIRRQIYAEFYERPEREAVAALVGPDDRVLELGAAIGVVTCVIVKAGPQASLHIEANPELPAAALRTLAANGLWADIRVGAVVPDDHDGDDVAFGIEDAFWSSAISAASPVRRVTVPALRLSRLLEEVSPTILVLDVEGAECALLSGPAFAGVRAISVELHRAVTGAPAQSAMLAHLLGLGFHIDFLLTSQENLVLRRDLH